MKRGIASLITLGRSPADPARGAAILTYHDTDPDPGGECWVDFAGQMALVEDLGYRVVSLADVVAFARGERELDEPSLAITFDDGFANNLVVAFPELARRGWPGTVFISTGFLGRRPFLLPEELPRLAEFGMELGNHTHSHRSLTRLEPEEIVSEIHECSRRLVDLSGQAPRPFCYPNGRYNARARRAVARSGVESACSSRVGRNGPGRDVFLLRRLGVEPRDRPRDLRLRLAGGYDFLDVKQVLAARKRA